MLLGVTQRSYTIQRKAVAVTEERVERFLCASAVGLAYIASPEQIKVALRFEDTHIGLSVTQFKL
jgi:hypothetical protein